MVQAACAKHCSSLTHEAEPDRDAKTLPTPLFLPVGSCAVSSAAWKQGGWQDYVWLIWGQLLVSQSVRWERRRRCQREALSVIIRGLEDDGGRALKCRLAGSQLEHDRHNLPSTCAAWLVAHPQCGCSGSLAKPAVLLLCFAAAAVVTLCVKMNSQQLELPHTWGRHKMANSAYWILSLVTCKPYYQVYLCGFPDILLGTYNWKCKMNHNTASVSAYSFLLEQFCCHFYKTLIVLWNLVLAIITLSFKVNVYTVSKGYNNNTFAVVLSM